MSCACHKIIDPSMNGLQYSLKSEDIVSVEGYEIMSPLFGPAKAPRGGWSVEIYFMGHATRINKTKPQLVADEVERLLKLNEILYTPVQLWLNLNIQWVARAVFKYQRVQLHHLLAIATPNF